MSLRQTLIALIVERDAGHASALGGAKAASYPLSDSSELALWMLGEHFSLLVF